MIDSNNFLLDLVGKNWMALIILYTMVRTIFPNVKVIIAIGDAFANLFPQFKKKE
jgi:hypothetical protein